MVESAATGDVEDQQGAARAPEIGASDGFVCFLAGGVPEREFHPFPLGGRVVGVLMLVVVVVVSVVVGGGCDGGTDGDDSRTEFDADGHIVVLDEATLTEPDGKRRFAGTAVTDADEFCDVVPWLGHY